MPSLPRLPKTLERVRVEQYIAPSSLVSGSVCVLRRQGREMDGRRIAGLIESPWAVVGTLVHRAIQISDRRPNIAEVFEELVRRREEELLKDPRRRHFVPLRGVVGEGGWSARIGILESRSGEGEPFPLSLLDDNGGVAPGSPHSSHEVWLESPELGLRGSADLIELIGDESVRITDWKTGSVLDSDGEVKTNYRLQLAAYRMLARERWPDRSVETCLFNGETVAVQVTKSDEDAVRQSVAEIRSTVDGRSDALAADLAQLGDDCFNCDIRHRCPAYMEELRKAGRGLPSDEHPWSGDVLGNVSSVQTRGDTTIVNLVLPSGASAQMRWSSERNGVPRQEEQAVAAFGLLPLARRSKVNGETLDPLVYEESGQSRRAWQAEIFEV